MDRREHAGDEGDPSMTAGRSMGRPVTNAICSAVALIPPRSIVTERLPGRSPSVTGFARFGPTRSAKSNPPPAFVALIRIWRSSIVETQAGSTGRTPSSQKVLPWRRKVAESASPDSRFAPVKTRVRKKVSRSEAACSVPEDGSTNAVESQLLAELSERWTAGWAATSVAAWSAPEAGAAGGTGVPPVPPVAGTCARALCTASRLVRSCAELPASRTRAPASWALVSATSLASSSLLLLLQAAAPMNRASTTSFLNPMVPSRCARVRTGPRRSSNALTAR
jgi:hypothetical protein